MVNKQTAHIIRGLRKDFSDSKQPKEYAIDAKNIRITNREDSSLLSITNEKGTQEIPLGSFDLRRVLGYSVLNNYIILFAKIFKRSLLDAILTYDVENSSWNILYSGNLGFSTENLIEALSVYENEDIQKVYWVDGVNQPRVINIAAKQEEIDSWTDKSFDFIQELQLNEIIKVEKSYSSGSFNSGVIQYAFNYYNKNGQESNIVEVTPINYISYEDRGAAPNEYVSNSFKITIDNVDTNFDYLRLYSIHRTALDAQPSVKLITDLKADKNTIEYIDTGIIGETVDPAELLFKGGEYIIPKTLAQKDGTLFFGNIKLNNNNINDRISELIERTTTIEESRITTGISTSVSGYYPYNKNLKENNTWSPGFKSRETYRLGVQFQDKTGKWSNPIFIKDHYINANPDYYLDSSKKLYHYKACLEVTLMESVCADLDNLGYRKVRPVVVYPQESEREVVAQGILCPTVFNAKDRQEGTCFAQSSWFLRPCVNKEITFAKDPDNPKDREPYTTNSYIYDYNTADSYQYIPEFGAWAEFRHYKPLPAASQRNAELQNSMIGMLKNTTNGYIYLNQSALVYNLNTDEGIRTTLKNSSTFFQDSYFVDQSILTFHSPEIELKNTNTQGCKTRIVGYIEFNSSVGDIDFTLKNSPLDSTNPSYINKSYFKGITQSDTINSNPQNAARSLISGAFFLDKNDKISGSPTTGHVIYPWQSESTLNSIVYYTNKDKYAVLKSKKISNLKYSNTTTYLDTPINIDCSSYLFSGEESLIIPVPKNIEFIDNVDTIVYKGNIDSIVSPYIPNSDYKFYVQNNNFSTDTWNEDTNYSTGRPKYTIDGNNNRFNFNSDYTRRSDSNIYTKDPIHIKYKSTPHVVLTLDYESDSHDIHQAFLNTRFNRYTNENLSAKFTYGGIKFNGFSYIGAFETGKEPTNAFLYMAELYRDEVPNKFGGDNYENNIWYPAGPSVRINADEDTTIEFTQGDTFFSRFDTLKTYSDDLDAVNSVTEIGSFMVETRINLDARYDRNRGKQSNLVMNPGNFNLFNDVYNQQDNFFNYRIIDKDIADNTKFPNTIVWSKQKFAGADVDPWTNINMASSLDLDGTKGELAKLVSFKNEIFSFQPEAINHILFNSRVQIPTSDGVPIELTNAYKVDGARQLSSIGSSNPLAITSTDRGIYYMDNITKGIYVFNGQQSESLSDKLGMSSWVKNQNIDLYKIDYDKINQDVYFIGTDNFRYKQCLGYSEKLGEFESFFDYNDSEIFNVKDGTYAIKSNNLYKLFEGDYNRFFNNESKPFWVTFTHNENPFNDKIYNTLEFRADTYNYITKDEQGNNITTPYWELSNNSSFNTIKVKNEYQDTEEVSLEFNRFTPSNLKRKFRIWRANIPRDFTNKRDRIRNTWTNITLKASNPGNTKTELHDLIVSYFM